MIANSTSGATPRRPHSPLSLGALVGLGFACCFVAAPATAQPEVVISDTFAVSKDRPAGSLLDDIAAETGQPWSATSGIVLESGYVTNGDLAMVHVAGVPFEAPDHAGYSLVTLEASVDASASDYIGVGFSSAATSGYWATGQVWMLVTSTGTVKVYARGIEYPLFVGPAPAGLNQLKLEYDLCDKTVRAWLNGTELTLTTTDLDDVGFDAEIHYAGFTGVLSPGSIAPGMLHVDELVVTRDLAVAPPDVTAGPFGVTVQRGFPTSLTGVVQGGTGPFTYEWQKRKQDCSVDCWEPVSAAFVSGQDSLVLQIAYATADHAGSYRLVVHDCTGTATPSNEAHITVLNQTIGCIPSESPLADLTVDFDQWNPGGTLVSWTQVSEGGEFESGVNGSWTPPDFGSITKEGATFPAGYDTVEIDFPSLSKQTQMRFSWGEYPTHSIDFPEMVGPGPATVTLDLKGTTWDCDQPTNGFCSRDITLTFATQQASGTISRIDVLPGPHLIFVGDPALRIDDQTPHSYGAGAEMTLHQTIQNVGCDLEAVGENDERAITYNLCKADGSVCYPEGLNLIHGGGHAEPGGELAAGDTWSARLLGTVTLPPANPANYGLWRLTGTFDNDLNKLPAVLEFDLVEHGKPDLFVNKVVPIELYQDIGAGEERLTWIRAETPVVAKIYIDSQQYPAFDVPIDIYVRGHMPIVGEPTEDWILAGDFEIEEIPAGGLEYVFEDLAVAGAMPAGSDWALLDLKIVVDPPGTPPGPWAVDEFDEGNNISEVPSWAPMSLGNLDQAVGTPGESTVAFIREFTTDDVTPPPSLPDTTCLDADQGVDVLSTYYNPSGCQDEPVMWWNFQLDEISEVSGLMVRYLRDGALGPPEMYAGFRYGHYDPAVDQQPDLTVSEQDISADRQWHTVIWRSGYGLDPFDSFESVPTFVHDGYPQGQLRTLFLGVETPSGASGFPHTYFDFARVWRTDDGPYDPWDAVPNGLWYDDMSTKSTWTPFPAQAHIGFEWNVALKVTVPEPHTPGDVTVTVVREEPDDTNTLTGVNPQQVAPNTYLYFLSDGTGTLWSPTVAGDYTFDVTISGDTETGNNHATYDVEVIDTSLNLMYRVFGSSDPWQDLPEVRFLPIDWQLALTVSIEGVTDPPPSVNVIRSSDSMQLHGANPEETEPGVFLYLLWDVGDSTRWRPVDLGVVIFDAVVPPPFDRSASFQIELLESHACPAPAVDLP